MLVTQLLSVAEAQPPHREQTNHPTGIRDVALVSDGTLQGTVVDAQGIRLPHRTVMISRQGYVAETRSDARGNFRVNGLRGGMYGVAVDGGQRVYRVWAPDTAPPCAVDKLLIVADSNIVRGQLVNPSRRKWLTDNAGQIALISAFIVLPIVYATKPYGS